MAFTIRYMYNKALWGENNRGKNNEGKVRDWEECRGFI